MVDREHVPRTEAAAEEVDDEGQHRPPGRGAAEESGDDEHGAEEASHAFVRDVAARKRRHGDDRDRTAVGQLHRLLVDLGQVGVYLINGLAYGIPDSFA